MFPFELAKMAQGLNLNRPLIRVGTDIHRAKAPDALRRVSGLVRTSTLRNADLIPSNDSEASIGGPALDASVNIYELHPAIDFPPRLWHC